jgi:hypothetical protein
MTNISNGIVNIMFVDCNFNRIIIFIYFRPIDSRFTSFTYKSTPFNI